MESRVIPGGGRLGVEDGAKRKKDSWTWTTVW